MKKLAHNSLAWRAMLLLYKAVAYQMRVEQLLPDLHTFKPVHPWQLRSACRTAMDRNYLDEQQGMYRLTAAGLAVVRDFYDVDEVGVATGIVATPATFRTNRVLGASTALARPYRPGMDDHLQIPSLMGETRKLPSGELIK